jgi:DNA-binding NarL/FixJ family response regulator
MNDAQQATRTRIIIVDDHPFFRQGIWQTLAAVPSFELIGQYDDGAKGLKAIRHDKPDVALLDVNLPTMNGLEVLRALQDENSPTYVLVLTAHHDTEQTLHVIRSGARAYASKNIQPETLVSMVQVVARGHYVLGGRRMNQDQVRFWVETQIANLSGPYPVDSKVHYIPLSPREMEVLKLVTHGMSNQEIALELSISQQTVKNHMTSVLRKLNVKDRTQAAIFAIRRGWVRIQN